MYIYIYMYILTANRLAMGLGAPVMVKALSCTR